jgi:alkylation response protein AidB-like acyl-CoA dehydrogenase
MTGETIGASGSALARYALGDDGGLLALGTAEQRERLLAPVLRGDLTAAFAFTDAREGPRTTAVRHGEAFVVSGVKSFVTDGPAADLLLTVARVTDNAGGPTGTALFVIPREAPGVILRRELKTLDGGIHGEFELHEVAVPAGDLLGEIGQGVPRALERITTVRLRVGAEACGTAAWVLEHAGPGPPPPSQRRSLAEREPVQAMLADCAVDLFAPARALCSRPARREPRRCGDRGGHGQGARHGGGRPHVDRAIHTGGAAVVQGHPRAALSQNPIVAHAEGTTEVLRLAIARNLPRAPAKIESHHAASRSAFSIQLVGHSSRWSDVTLLHSQGGYVCSVPPRG